MGTEEGRERRSSQDAAVDHKSKKSTNGKPSIAEKPNKCTEAPKADPKLKNKDAAVDRKSKRSKEEISTPRSVDKGRLHKHKEYIDAPSESDFLNNVVPGHVLCAGSPILNMEQSKGSPATSKLESGEFQEESSSRPSSTYKGSPTITTTPSSVLSPWSSPSPLVLKQSESNGKGGGNPSKLSPVPFPELHDSTPMSSESKLKKGGDAHKHSFPKPQRNSNSETKMEDGRGALRTRLNK